MADGMRAPAAPIGHPDVLWGLPGQGGLLTEWAESVPDLTWPESVRTYGRMRRDARLSAVLKAFILPILRSTWAVDPEGIDRAEAVDLVAADLGLPILGEKTDLPPTSPVRGFSWHDHVRLAMNHLVYGHMPFERWFEYRGGRTRLAGIQERLPHTVSIIDVGEDGYVNQVFQNTQDTPIPANRLTWYVNEREGANWAGVSLLRSCYTPWILKHETMRVHATSIRRFGMGVPNVIAPPGGTPGQVAQAQQLASQMRVGDQSGAGLPNGFTFQLTGLTGTVPDAVAFLSYCDNQMTVSALAQIVELAHGTYGSRALGESFLDLFLLGLQAVADAIGDTATWGDPAMPGIARALVEYNWGEGEPVPRIRATDVGDRHEITAYAISSLVTAGALMADPNLDAFIRTAWGLPERAEGFPPPASAAPKPPPGGQAGAGGGTTAQPEAPAAEGGEVGGAEVSARAPRLGAARTARKTAARKAPAVGPPASGKTRTRRAAAAGPPGSGLRRPVTAVEAAAAMDPEVIRDEARAEVARLRSQWEPVGRAMRQDLAEQVAAAVDDGHLDRVGHLRPDTGPAAELIAAAMGEMAWTGARRMIREAAAQGVVIDPASVRIDDAALGQVAKARAGLIGARLADAAARKALTVVKATAGSDAAQTVTVHLAGLSDTPLEDALMAAMTAAQNMGRIAAATAGIDEGQLAYIYASEILDDNTCPPCDAVDQTQFLTLADAEGAYPSGGYAFCEGQDRCRGTIVVDWGTGPLTVTSPGGPGFTPGGDATSADEGEY